MPLLTGSKIFLAFSPKTNAVVQNFSQGMLGSQLSWLYLSVEFSYAWEAAEESHERNKVKDVKQHSSLTCPQITKMIVSLTHAAHEHLKTASEKQSGKVFSCYHWFGFSENTNIYVFCPVET